MILTTSILAVFFQRPGSVCGKATMLRDSLVVVSMPFPPDGRNTDCGSNSRRLPSKMKSAIAQLFPSGIGLV